MVGPSRAATSADVDLAWRSGVLDWKLDANQRGIYDQFHGSTSRRFVLNCARRLGKSYLLCLIALEYCLRHPGSYVRFAAPTAKQCKTIVLPLLRKILADCPADLVPEFVAQDLVLYFPNGSELHIAGCDAGNAERLRGSEAHLAIVDEAGSVSDLEYVVQDILLPQTLTTDGRILIASTPPRTPEHPFVKRYITDAIAQGAYAHRTIFDNPRLRPHQIAEYQGESGGAHTTTWKREYLAEIIIDENRAVLPEFTYFQDRLIRAVERPAHFDAYVSMDIGFLDLTVVLFGYWDFLETRLVIEDEVCIRRMTTPELAVLIQRKETELWGGQAPVRRVSDINYHVITDLTRLHHLKFVPTRKDDKEAQVNQTRMMLGSDPPKILVHPRCRTLIAHGLAAVWNDARVAFERIGDDSLAGEIHHFDAVDALIYLVRNLNRNRNPYPHPNAGIDRQVNFVHPAARPAPADAVLASVFGGHAARSGPHR